MKIAADWLPTAANINALPAPLRRYIHDLETNADPAGTVRENALVRDENAALRALVAELKTHPPKETLMKIKITVNGPGGELDSSIVEAKDIDDGDAITPAVLELANRQVWHVGDSMTVDEIEA